MSDSYGPTREWLYPQRFDYAPANEMWAEVWIEARLEPNVGPPAAPLLAIHSRGLETSHPAFLSCTGRLRANGARPVPGAVPDACAGDLLWRARFSVPLELLDDRAAEFILRAAGGVTIALPAPKASGALEGALLAPPARSRARRRAVAFAAGFAAASMPVTAAAAATTGRPSGASGASTTTTATTPSDPSQSPTTGLDGSGTTGTTTTGTTTTTTGTTTTTTTTTGTTTTSPTTTTTGTSTPTGTTTTPATPPSSTPTTTSTPTPAPPATSTVAPLTGTPVHHSGGDSIPTPAAPSTPAAGKIGSHHTGKHRTELSCTTLTAKQRAKLSKRALAQLERTASKTRARCMAVTKKKRHSATHGEHRVVHRDLRGGASISGGAGVKPVVLAPATDDTMLTGGPTLFQPNPAAADAWSRLSLLFARGDRPPPFLIPIYKAAGRKYHVPWPVLAAINAVETDYGRDLKTSSAGAMGWMQFMPGTWLEYAVAVGNHTVPNPYDPRDAIFSAARYLAANGARHSLRRAIFAYNHARWYVDEVLWTAANVVDHSRVRGPRARIRLAAMQAMASALEGEPYLWGGGHDSWEISAGYDCSGFVSAVLHSAGYLRAPVTTQALPSQRNILQGPGRYVTIFDRTDGGGLADDHVIIDLHGEWWESGGTSAAGVHRIKHISASYLLTFNQILHPRGL